MKQYKELTNNEMQKIQGGATNFGTCVLGAYGAAGVGAVAGAKFGPLVAAGSALAAELKYMGSKKCFG